MRTFLIATLLGALFSCVTSQCILGLQVFNKSNHIVLPLAGCNDVIDTKALTEQPTVTFNRPNYNDTYLLMLLEAHPNNHDMFILHWLLLDIKPSGHTLQTRVGVRDLTQGYFAPVNQTQYEFRLYNMTGKSIFDTVNAAERNFFLPSQWLAKHNIHSAPLAKTTFTVKAFIPGPPGWVVSPYPVGSQPPAFHPLPPAQYPAQPPQTSHPTQHLPNYPTQPPLYTQLPASQHPAQPLPPYSQQPVLPVGQPHPPIYHPQNPPQPAYPTQVVPQPHHPQYPFQTTPKYPVNNQFASTNLVQTQYNINGTMFRVLSHERYPYNVLNINSTLYTSDSYNKRFKLTSYLIIDNKSYIWRNLTHLVGSGPSVFINGTLYVPFSPKNEVHHYHYHKGAASSLNPSILLFTIIIPSLLCIFRS